MTAQQRPWPNGWCEMCEALKGRAEDRSPRRRVTDGSICLLCRQFS